MLSSKCCLNSGEQVPLLQKAMELRAPRYECGCPASLTWGGKSREPHDQLIFTVRCSRQA